MQHQPNEIEQSINTVTLAMKESSPTNTPELIKDYQTKFRLNENINNLEDLLKELQVEHDYIYPGNPNKPMY